MNSAFQNIDPKSIVLNADGSLTFNDKKLLLATNTVVSNSRGKTFTNHNDCISNDGPECADTNTACNNEQYCAKSVNNGPCSNLACSPQTTVNNGDCNDGDSSGQC